MSDDQNVPTAIDSPSSAEVAETVERPARKPRRFLRYFLGSLFLIVTGLAIVVALLPQILAGTALKQQITNTLLKDFQGSVDIGGADLAWWKPAELTSLTMSDKEGVTVATIESAEVTTPLWKMIWPGKEIKPYELTIRKPKIVYEIDAYGKTNWASLFPSKRKPGDPFVWPDFTHSGPALNIKVVGGELKLVDKVSGRTIQSRNINIKLQKSMKLLAGSLTGETVLKSQTGQTQPAGTMEAKFQISMENKQPTAGQVEGKLEKTPLELIQPWLKQTVPHLYLAAKTADGDFKTKWTGTFRTGLKLDFTGTLKAGDIEMRSSEWFPHSEISAESLTGQFNIDNTLPTAPGAFQLDLLFANCHIDPLPLKEEETPTQRPQPVEFKALDIDSSGIIDVLNQQLDLKKFDLNSDICKLNVAGKVTQFSKQPHLDLKGTSTGDIMPLLQVAFPRLNDMLEVEDFHPSEFEIKGALPEKKAAQEETNDSGDAATNAEADTAPIPPVRKTEPLKAVAKWGWTSLKCAGVTSEKGSFWTRFDDQQLKIVPISLPIGDEGKFTGVTTIDFRGAEPILALEPGEILSDVEFTTGMCRRWLKYLSPLFAGATDIEGKFSLTMQDLMLNLETGQPEKLKGALEIESCRVGPGPTLRQAMIPLTGLLRRNKDREGGMLQQGAKWVELPEQEVVFWNENQRVYHEGLTFNSGTMQITSRGSVGLDQTLDLKVKVPLSIGGDETKPLARFLSQKPIELNIQGTFDKPQLQTDPLKQFGVGAASSLLQGIIERRRDRSAE